MPTPTTTVRLPPHLRQQLQRYAKARNQTNTGVIIQALRTFFEQKEAAEHKYQVRQELARLAEIDRADPELDGFFSEPETDPFGEES